MQWSSGESRDVGHMTIGRKVDEPLRKVTIGYIYIPALLCSCCSIGPETLPLFHSASHLLTRAFQTGASAPKLVQGASTGGAYFLKDASGKNLVVVKPEDEEPFAVNNPKRSGELADRDAAAVEAAAFGNAAGKQPTTGVPSVSPASAGNAVADRIKTGIFPGEGACREVAAYLLDHSHHAGVPPTAFVLTRHPAFHTSKRYMALASGVPVSDVAQTLAKPPIAASIRSPAHASLASALLAAGPLPSANESVDGAQRQPLDTSASSAQTRSIVSTSPRLRSTHYQLSSLSQVGSGRLSPVTTGISVEGINFGSAPPRTTGGPAYHSSSLGSIAEAPEGGSQPNGADGAVTASGSGASVESLEDESVRRKRLDTMLASPYYAPVAPRMPLLEQQQLQILQALPALAVATSGDAAALSSLESAMPGLALGGPAPQPPSRSGARSRWPSVVSESEARAQLQQLHAAPASAMSSSAPAHVMTLSGRASSLRKGSADSDSSAVSGLQLLDIAAMHSGSSPLLKAQSTATMLSSHMTSLALSPSPRLGPTAAACAANPSAALHAFSVDVVVPVAAVQGPLLPAVPIKRASMQLFVPHYCSAEDVSSSLWPVEQVHKIAIHDIRLCNTDRNDDNILVRAWFDAQDPELSQIEQDEARDRDAWEHAARAAKLLELAAAAALPSPLDATAGDSSPFAPRRAASTGTVCSAGSSNFATAVDSSFPLLESPAVSTALATPQTTIPPTAQRPDGISDGIDELAEEEEDDDDGDDDNGRYVEGLIAGFASNDIKARSGAVRLSATRRGVAATSTASIVSCTATSKPKLQRAASNAANSTLSSVPSPHSGPGSPSFRRGSASSSAGADQAFDVPARSTALAGKAATADPAALLPPSLREFHAGPTLLRTVKRRLEASLSDGSGSSGDLDADLAACSTAAGGCAIVEDVLRSDLFQLRMAQAAAAVAAGASAVSSSSTDTSMRPTPQGSPTRGALHAAEKAGQHVCGIPAPTPLLSGGAGPFLRPLMASLSPSAVPDYATYPALADARSVAMSDHISDQFSFDDSGLESGASSALPTPMLGAQHRSHLSLGGGSWQLLAASPSGGGAGLPLRPPSSLSHGSALESPALASHASPSAIAAASRHAMALNFAAGAGSGILGALQNYTSPPFQPLNLEVPPLGSFVGSGGIALPEGSPDALRQWKNQRVKGLGAVTCVPGGAAPFVFSSVVASVSAVAPRSPAGPPKEIVRLSQFTEAAVATALPHAASESSSSGLAAFPSINAPEPQSVDEQSATIELVVPSALTASGMRIARLRSYDGGNGSSSGHSTPRGEPCAPTVDPSSARGLSSTSVGPPRIASFSGLQLPGALGSAGMSGRSTPSTPTAISVLESARFGGVPPSQLSGGPASAGSAGGALTSPAPHSGLGAFRAGLSASTGTSPGLSPSCGGSAFDSPRGTPGAFGAGSGMAGSILFSINAHVPRAQSLGQGISTLSPAPAATVATPASTTALDATDSPVAPSVSLELGDLGAAPAPAPVPAAVESVPVPAPKPAPWRSARLTALMTADAAAQGKPPVAHFDLGAPKAAAPSSPLVTGAPHAPGPASYAAALRASLPPPPPPPEEGDDESAGRSDDEVGRDEPDARKLKAARRVELVPIDHGLCLPTINALDEVALNWVHWRQARVPLSESDRRYVLSLDDRADALMLSAVMGDRVRHSCLLTLRICTVLLQEGVRAGLSVGEIGAMMTRGTGVGVLDPTEYCSFCAAKFRGAPGGEGAARATLTPNGVVGAVHISRRSKKKRARALSGADVSGSGTPSTAPPPPPRMLRYCHACGRTSGHDPSAPPAGSKTAHSALEQAVKKAKTQYDRRKRAERRRAGRSLAASPALGPTPDPGAATASAAASSGSAGSRADAINTGAIDTGTLSFLPYHDALVSQFRGVITAHIAAALGARGSE